MNHLLRTVLILLLTSSMAFGQKAVSITIDDVPNTKKFQQDHFKSLLLNQLDDLAIPIAIFINEGLVYKNDLVARNIDLLGDWISRDYVLAGNHTFSHPYYSEIGLDSFVEDIKKGALLSSAFSKLHSKTYQYFRFPYNDLGEDSLQQLQINRALKSLGYVSTPFTVESSDWMFNAVYEHYLSAGEPEKAKAIGDLYVEKTIAAFHFFDSLSVQIYKRPIKQIYLCHDNALNANYLGEIVKQLKALQYDFISLDEALEDPVYQQENNFYKKWGISWFYRWMSSQTERVKWMKQEPDMGDIEGLYESLFNNK